MIKAVCHNNSFPKPNTLIKQLNQCLIETQEKLDPDIMNHLTFHLQFNMTNGNLQKPEPKIGNGIIECMQQ